MKKYNPVILYRVLIIFAFIFQISVCLAQQVEPSKVFNIYFTQDFEDDTPGPYDYDEWSEDWDYPSWANRQVVPDIITSADPENSSKVMRFHFPEGSIGPAEGGGQWYKTLNEPFHELYFSYRIKFKPGFQWVLGGKIPGVRGGPEWEGFDPPPWDKGFIVLLMWNNRPGIDFYYYHHDQQHTYGDSRTWDYTIEADRWYTITIRVVLNSVDENGGFNDGILEGFIDNQMVCQVTGLKLRNLSEIGTDNLIINSFFGGSTDEWASIRDEWIDLDDFITFTYKDGVDVPQGNEPSPSDRHLVLPFQEISDSIWRKSLTGYPVSSKTVGLEWKNYFYPTTYTIQRKLQADSIFKDITTVNFPEKSFFSSNLSPNTTYNFRIKAENSLSDPVEITTLSPAPPQAPTSLISLEVDKKLVRIRWNDNSNNETGFIIERSDITSDNFRQVSTVKQNIREYSDNSVIPNTDYHYRIKAINEDGESAFSNMLSVKTLLLEIPAAPTELNAINITKNSFVLTWKDNSNNETGFRIYKLDSIDGLFKLSQTVASNVKQLSVANLQPNTSHTYKLRAYNSDGSSAYTNELKVTTLPLQPPVAPITLIYDSLAAESVSLAWTDRSNNEKGFYVYRSVSETTGYQLIHTTGSNQNTYKNTNLAAGTSYYFRVRAYNDDGISAYTNTLRIITLNPPRSPTDLMLISKSKTAVSFEWMDNADNETGLIVEKSVNNDHQFTQIDTLNPDTSQYIDQNLLSNTLYFYRLAAFNLDGSSKYSDTLKVQTNPLDLPAPPTNSRIIDYTPFSIVLAWDDNSTNETGFQIQRASQNKAFAALTTVGSNSMQFTDTSVQENTIYYYRIRAYNGDGYSAFSDTLFFQTPENVVPLSPTDFVVELLKHDEVILTWNENFENITGFEIEKMTGSSGSFIVYAKLGKVTELTDTMVEQGSSYSYQIRSFNQYNYSDYSDTINVTIPLFNLPLPPSSLATDKIAMDQISIKWKDNSSDETGFIIKKTTTSQDEFEEVYTTDANDTIFTDNKVLASTTYYYSVFAINELGESEGSNKLRVSTRSLAESLRHNEGLIAYYNFSLNSDTLIHDLSGYGQPVDLLITDTMKIGWNFNGRLEVLDNTIICSVLPASKIINACKETNEITLECWIKPSLNQFHNDASIVSLSQDPEHVGISLIQSDFSLADVDNYRYKLGLSTKSTELNGKPYLTSDKNMFVTLHHIVYTRNYSGEEAMYLNGKLIANSIKPLGFDNWKNDFHLYLGNESNLENPWTGTYYLVAIYDRVLTTDQILQNFNAGPTDNIISSKNTFEVNLYPNPTAGKVIFDIKPTEISEFGGKVILQLIDINGFIRLGEVLKDSNQPFIKEYDLSTYQKGVYYLRILSPSSSNVYKLIIY